MHCFLLRARAHLISCLVPDISGPADVQEIPYMECFICNRKSLRGAGNYIRKKAAFIDSLQLIVSRRGIDQIRCRFDCKFG